MSSINTTARELLLKVVFYGPGLGGKTTSLQAVFANAPPDRRGKLVSLATPVDRTLYFDFLPLRLPPHGGLSVRAQLFTVPGQVYFNATRRLVLAGADGIVFVADSQRERLEANVESLDNLRDNLVEHGRDLARVPHVMLWNKRDLESVTAIDDLERVLNLHRAPSFATVATRGEGVPDALEAILKLVLDAQELPAIALPSPPPPPVRRSPPMADAPPASQLEEALADAAHRQPSAPRQSAVARFAAETAVPDTRPALKATKAAPADAPPPSVSNEHSKEGSNEGPSPSQRAPAATREYTESTNAAPYPVSASLFPKALR
ncbi:MAG: ATP/GTP-binding protein, partial [Polyangiales bacterium]